MVARMAVRWSGGGLRWWRGHHLHQIGWGTATFLNRGEHNYYTVNGKSVSHAGIISSYEESVAWF